MSALAESAWLGDLESPAAPNVGGRPAKGHSGRQRKVHCELCGFIAYASRAALRRSGFPRCGCGEPLVLANLRDRAAVEWDALERELASYGRDTYNAAMRELGWRGMVEPDPDKVRRDGSGAGAWYRCEHGSCTKRVSGPGRYCREHEHKRPAMGAAHRRAA